MKGDVRMSVQDTRGYQTPETLRPLVDFYGHMPEPPSPCFVQVVDGKICEYLTAADLAKEVWETLVGTPDTHPAPEDALAVAGIPLHVPVGHRSGGSVETRCYVDGETWPCPTPAPNVETPTWASVPARGKP
jgi:hypothetical protein